MSRANDDGSIRNFTVLILGSDTRSFLSIVRSLGRKGANIVVAPVEFASVALHSKYISQIVRLPLASLGLDAWQQALREICEEIKPDLVIPCDERGILPIKRCLADLGPYRFALPNADAYDIFFDKVRTREAAMMAGVPVPEGRPLRQGDTAEDLVAAFGLPLFIKPASSYVLHDLQARQNVKMCTSVGDIAKALRSIDDIRAFFVEKEFRGEGVGVSVLSDEGEVRQIFQHRRVHEPHGGGASSYRRSEKLNPLLERYTRMLCRHTKLSGVAMFEYKTNRDEQRYALLEVNARFWGSLPLAVHAGVDFPALLVEQSVLGRKSRQVHYRENVFARNLLSDLYSLIDNMRKTALSNRKRMAMAVHWAFSHRRLLSGKEVQDVFWWTDSKPARQEFLALSRQIGRQVTNRLPRLRQWYVAAEKKRLAKRLAQAAGRKLAIVFICDGNICRSPYAARALAAKIPADQADIQGASLLYRDGRQSPDHAIAEAGKRGIDLSTHRSSYASDESLARADLVLCFDQKNLIKIADRGLAEPQKVFLLGNLTTAGRRDGEIVDPIGKSRAVFAEVYDRIDEGLSVLAGMIREKP